MTLLSEPLMQLRGYSPEPLACIRYDLANTAGIWSNQEGHVTHQVLDSTLPGITTNWFDCLDIELTDGTNALTLYLTDLAGNVSTNVYTYVRDYSDDTNAPMIRVYWPEDGAQICGSLFTVRGRVDTATATVSVDVSAGGETNSMDAIVERDGKLWAEDLSLAEGTNAITLMATDPAGNVTTTNWLVTRSSLNLTIDPVGDWLLNDSYVSVSGGINSTNHKVWVNGVEATVNANGYWQAERVPLNDSGTAVIQARAIPNSDNGGNGSGGGDGQTMTDDDPGNPDSNQAQDAEYTPEKPAAVVTTQFQLDLDDETNQQLRPGDSEPWDGKWTDMFRWTWGKAGTLSSDKCYGFPSDQYYEWNDAQWGENGLGTIDSGLTRGDHICGTQDYTNLYEFTVQTTWAGQKCEVAAEREVSSTLKTYTDHRNSRHAYTLHEFRTGGKAVAKCKHLFVFSGSANDTLNPFYPEWDTETATVPIASENIALGSLGSLGSDGLLYKGLEDGTTQDATTQTDSTSYYRFPQPGFSKHDFVTQTACSAPTNASRTTIGIGEQVACSIVPPISVNWSVDGGGTVNPTNGSSTIFTSLPSPSTSTVRAKIGNEELTKTFTVVAPSGISVSVKTNWGYGALGTNSIGADTQYWVTILPTNASFVHAQMRENISPAVTNTWPDGSKFFVVQTNAWGLGDFCLQRFPDTIAEPLNPISKLFDGTNYRSFSYTLDYHNEYLNQDGEWIPFVAVQTVTEYQSNGACRETYQGVPGEWQGPWE